MCVLRGGGARARSGGHCPVFSGEHGQGCFELGLLQEASRRKGKEGRWDLALHLDPCVDGLAGLSLGSPRGSQKGALSMGVGSRLPRQALLMLDLGPGLDIISSHLLKVGKLMTQRGEAFCLKYYNDSGA